jgi:DNA (cytosine-5)-methyltransferase 1
MINYKVADLFCGVGGLSLGFEKAGFSIELAIDNWKDAIEVYSENFSHDCLSYDLSNVKGISKILKDRDANVIIGGPPCQDFSHAGKRIEGERADLTESFANIVKAVKPVVFVMENVERTKGSNSYLKARKIYKASGYGLTEVVLDASLCGVPQKRKRFFCIGIRNEEDDFLFPILNSKLGKSPMTMRQYFKKSLDTDFYYRHPRNYSRRGVYSLDEPSATIRGVNRPIPPGYTEHSADAGEISLARPLTTNERAQVQTFPKSFKWIGSKTNVEQMIGNAVPVNLGKFVADCVLSYLRNKSQPV